MKKKHPLIAAVLLTALAIMACGNHRKQADQAATTAAAEAQDTVTPPTFCADSAYRYVREQVDFGPRVPNTQAHRDCGDYLIGKLRQFGATVSVQEADLVAYDNTILKARNIIGSYQPENRRRVLLCAHWDSRPYADAERNKKRQREPILGANDGASGVGVLLELARLIQQRQPAIGIDIIFFDAEDYGMPTFHRGQYKPDTWCLGSQYWGRVPHTQGYNARYGILLDMVGGRGATFYRELFSQRTASAQVKKIWDTAARLGFQDFFPQADGTEVTDDHIYVYNLTRIPCVDIINYDPQGDTGFGDFWHTHDDNMDIIDRATLNAVGTTVATVIYNEK